MNKTLPRAGVFKVPSKASTSRPQNRERHCDGTCQQGEGDCDWDSECLPGLKCKFDWWFGTDVCTAGKGFSHVHRSIRKRELRRHYWLWTGPTTKNFTWTDWGEWGECLGDRCGSGEVGMRIRIRDCIPPVSEYRIQTAMRVDLAKVSHFVKTKK